MQIKVNGETHVTNTATLADLLAEMEMDGRVATAVNESFVPAQNRAETKLNNGDRVEILAPMQGG